jgi:outer membrane immunogenic protein
VLTYQGKEYPFSVQGLSAGDIGASSAEAAGDVYGLKKLEDFNGYTSTSAGAAVGGGGGAATMRNQNGVGRSTIPCRWAVPRGRS